MFPWSCVNLVVCASLFESSRSSGGGRLGTFIWFSLVRRGETSLVRRAAHVVVAKLWLEIVTFNIRDAVDSGL